ncbi:hypothetical protein PIB30_070721 [Stylosanthes scabra]|uniref:Uncharacterized protein n=1 Tax=Stylosanthes scabra TaxID=79078 RepID=A0ABU6UNI4_9FABA|nr:hypothetical protein [Stylosanthes scabra]
MRSGGSSSATLSDLPPPPPPPPQTDPGTDQGTGSPQPDDDPDYPSIKSSTDGLAVGTADGNIGQCCSGCVGAFASLFCRSSRDSTSTQRTQHVCSSRHYEQRSGRHQIEQNLLVARHVCWRSPRAELH